MQGDIYIDPDTGDIALPLRWVTGAELVQQRIRIRLRRYEGEWFANQEVGLPYFAWEQELPPPLREIVQRIQFAISNVPGVLGTRNFEGTHDELSRTINVTGDVIYTDQQFTTFSFVQHLLPLHNAAPVRASFGPMSHLDGGIGGLLSGPAAALGGR